MEQKNPKKHKRGWSVIVSIRVEGHKIVRGGKHKIMRESYTILEYCFTNVTKLFKKNGILHIIENKIEHKFDINRVEMLQIREHKRSGMQ